MQIDGMLKQFRESKNGYITLNSNDFNTLVDGVSRSYSVYVFADSTKLGNSKSLSLSRRLNEIGMVGKSYVKTHKGTDNEDKVVIVRLVLEDSKDSLLRLGAKGLPYFGFIPANLEIKSGSGINLSSKNLMTPGPVEDWGAEAIANFVAATCGISPGDMAELHARSPLLPLFVLLILGSLAVVGYKFAQSPWIHWMPLYAVGSLVVFWFSLSGGMYNIIRGVPMIGIDPRTRQARTFMQGSGQMGIEGYVMGTLAMSFGLLMAAGALVVPKLEDAQYRRKLSYAILVIAALLFNWITGTHLWKTHLHTSFYI